MATVRRNTSKSHPHRASHGTVGDTQFVPGSPPDDDGPSPPESRYMWYDMTENGWPGTIEAFWSQGIISALPSYAEGNPNGVSGVSLMLQDPALSAKVNAWLRTFSQPIKFAHALDAYPLYDCPLSPIASFRRYLLIPWTQATCWFGRAAKMYLDYRRAKFVQSIRPTARLQMATRRRAFGLAGPRGAVGAPSETEKVDWLMWGGIGLLAAAGGIFGLTYWRERQDAQEYRSNPRGKLISSTETASAEKKIRSAAAAKFGRGKAQLFFEHGQWFTRIDKGDYDQDWSVVDAYPGVAGTGIDFEELGSDW